MKNKNDILYIFLHVPKCAGLTFRYHVLKNFKKSECLWLPINLLPIRGKQRRNICKFKDYDDYKERVEKYLSSLRRKDKIKIILGHDIPYGVHKFFDKTPRYITFLRNPASRTISLYNFYRQSYKTYPEKYEHMLIDGAFPTFRKWLELKYDKGNVDNAISMHDFFKKNDYGSMPGKILNKFYFIGITENFDRDSLFLYHELGINKFFENQNVSVKYFSPNYHNTKIKQMIAKKNVLDKKLYDYALKINKKLSGTRNFHTIVMQMKNKKALAATKRANARIK